MDYFVYGGVYMAVEKIRHFLILISEIAQPVAKYLTLLKY
jgi:hypothetical protein